MISTGLNINRIRIKVDTMKSEKSESKHTFLSLFVVLPLLFHLSGCGGGKSSPVIAASDTGAINFTLTWQDPADQDVFIQAPGNDVCVDYSIERVNVNILDASHAIVTSQDWPCSSRGGIIDGVPDGSDMVFTVEGFVADNVEWRSEPILIPIHQGSDTDVGTIAMYYVGDYDAPTPDPATWASFPAAEGMDTITMTATAGSDASGTVEYFFEETSGNPGADNSDWQSNPTYTDTGLSADTQYTYRVRMRDAHGNTGGWSTPESAVTPSVTPPDNDAPTPDPATWAAPPAATGTDTIAMTATTGSDASGTVEYFFEETSGNPGADNSGWQSSPTYTDTGLSEDTQYTYRVRMRDAYGNTGGWSTSESAVTQSSVVISNLALSAATDTSYVSPWESLGAVNDAYIPTSSSDDSGGAYGNYRGIFHYGDWNWVAYDFGATCQIVSTDVYWWDDLLSVDGPSEAFIEYWNGSRWVNAGSIGVALDQWNTLDFEVSTSRLRIRMRSNRATGILEWQVWGSE
jgi:chitodextrinase